MDNMNQPPASDSPDRWPTQELQPPAGPAAPPGQPWSRPAGPGGRPPGRGPVRRRRALWWSTGLALAALMAGAGLLVATHGSAAHPAGPAGQAALLNSMLSSASSSASDAAADNALTGSPAFAARACQDRAAKLKAAGHPFAARVVLWRCRRVRQRVRLLGGIHGQFTFGTRTGTRTLAYERGVIQSVSGTDVVVRARDGTTWTWVPGRSTVIRESGRQVTASALSDGENVFAGGPVVSGAHDARLIVIRAGSGTVSPSPASGS